MFISLVCVVVVVAVLNVLLLLATPQPLILGVSFLISTVVRRWTLFVVCATEEEETVGVDSCCLSTGAVTLLGCR